MTCWADQFRTYEEACIYYGCDTPAQIEEEMRYNDELEAIVTQDELEAHGGSHARNLATAAEHVAWCRKQLLREPTDAELARIVLWGATRGRSVEHDAAPTYDDIPF